MRSSIQARARKCGAGLYPCAQVSTAGSFFVLARRWSERRIQGGSPPLPPPPPSQRSRCAEEMWCAEASRAAEDRSSAALYRAPAVATASPPSRLGVVSSMESISAWQARRSLSRSYPRTFHSSACRPASASCGGTQRAALASAEVAAAAAHSLTWRFAARHPPRSSDFPSHRSHRI